MLFLTSPSFCYDLVSCLFLASDLTWPPYLHLPFNFPLWFYSFLGASFIITWSYVFWIRLLANFYPLNVISSFPLVQNPQVMLKLIFHRFIVLIPKLHLITVFFSLYSPFPSSPPSPLLIHIFFFFPLLCFQFFLGVFSFL